MFVRTRPPEMNQKTQSLPRKRSEASIKVRTAEYWFRVQGLGLRFAC